MWCEKCGNRIKELFIYKDNKYICRKCLVYKEDIKIENKSSGKGDYKLNYDLTTEQKKASEFILENIKNSKDCILNAVTGAGKTEIIYPLIKYCVDNKKTIAITIPRKDVVVELYRRIKKDFKLAKIVSVYGGCNKDLCGDVIILTTHQLYRYKNYFDVIVIDEVDAFPFYKNKILEHFLNRCRKGNIVYMSATIQKELIKKKYPIYFLNKRYHNKKLDIPIVKKYRGFKSVFRYINKYKNSICIVYFPTIKEQIRFHKKLKQEHYLLNSKTENRKEILEKLHTLDDALILSTLVLERGVTFKNANVIVVNADHDLFDSANLIQISGRVGRHYVYNSGEIIFMAKNKNNNIKDAIKFIKKCNE